MTSVLDERIRAAAGDLLVRAAAHPLPDLEGSSRRSRVPLVVGAAAAVVAIVAAGMVAGDGARPVVDVPAVAIAPPSGITPAIYEAHGLGLRFEVGDDWTRRDTVASELLLQPPDGRAMVNLFRMTPEVLTDAEAFGELRRTFLAERFDLTYEQSGVVDVDGRPASVGAFDLVVAEEPWVARDVSVDMGDGTFTTLVVSASDAERADELFAWIASTIELDDALDDVAGFPSYEVVQHDLGFAVEILDGWGEGSSTEPSFFEVAIGDPRGYVLANRLPSQRLVTWAEDLEASGARDIEVTETEHGGRPATRLTYRYPDGHGFVVHDTEVQIDVGDGTVVQVVISHGGGLPDAVVQRLIESVRLLP